MNKIFVKVKSIITWEPILNMNIDDRSCRHRRGRHSLMLRDRNNRSRRCLFFKSIELRRRKINNICVVENVSTIGTKVQLHFLVEFDVGCCALNVRVGPCSCFSFSNFYFCGFCYLLVYFILHQLFSMIKYFVPFSNL